MKSILKVVAVYDNGGESLDRYTIVTNSKTGKVGGRYLYKSLASSETGSGIFMWTECIRGKHLGKKVKLSDLHEDLQKRIKLALH